MEKNKTGGPPINGRDLKKVHETYVAKLFDSNKIKCIHCKKLETTIGNDIIGCDYEDKDGNECKFWSHQLCLGPMFQKEDEKWFCPQHDGLDSLTRIKFEMKNFVNLTEKVLFDKILRLALLHSEIIKTNEKREHMSKQNQYLITIGNLKKQNAELVELNSKLKKDGSNDELVKKIEVLETKLKKSGSNAELVKKIEVLETKLKKALETIDVDTIEIQSELKGLKRKNKRIEEAYSKTFEVSQAYKKENEELENEKDKLKSEVKKFKLEIEKLRRELNESPKAIDL